MFKLNLWNNNELKTGFKLLKTLLSTYPDTNTVCLLKNKSAFQMIYLLLHLMGEFAPSLPHHLGCMSSPVFIFIFAVTLCCIYSLSCKDIKKKSFKKDSWCLLTISNTVTYTSESGV